MGSKLPGTMQGDRAKKIAKINFNDEPQAIGWNEHT
jgi:hypothetical protein